MIPEEWKMAVVVLGLVLALLLASSLVQRYQRYKAEQRARLRRVLATIASIEGAMEKLKILPLSREVRVMLRGEVLDRFKLVRRIHRAYPDLEQRLQQARSRMDSEGPDSGGSVPPVQDQQQFQALQGALGELIDFLGRAGKGARQKENLLRELKERNAEVLASFHIVQASRAREQGDTRLALRHLHSLMEQLSTRGPNTVFVRQLYQEAEKLHHEYMVSRDKADKTEKAESKPEDAA